MTVESGLCQAITHYNPLFANPTTALSRFGVVKPFILCRYRIIFYHKGHAAIWSFCWYGNLVWREMSHISQLSQKQFVWKKAARICLWYINMLARWHFDLVKWNLIFPCGIFCFPWTVFRQIFQISIMKGILFVFRTFHDQ